MACLFQVRSTAGGGSRTLNSATYGVPLSSVTWKQTQERELEHFRKTMPGWFLKFQNATFRLLALKEFAPPSETQLLVLSSSCPGTPNFGSGDTIQNKTCTCNFDGGLGVVCSKINQDSPGAGQRADLRPEFPAAGLQGSPPSILGSL